MTKKILFGMMAATMMFATSCENELDLGTNAGEKAQVTFSVGTPEIATRAYSDGQTATVLQYAVYDAAGNELTDLTVTDAEIHVSTTVNLQLTTGNTYSVIFWAAAEDAPYTVDFGAKTMTVDYTNAVSNDEARDAFYKYHTFTVTGAQTETIELKRPFAQLNIGTADYAASTSAGYTPAYSYVKVPVSKVLNLVDGEVDEAAAVEFKLAAIPQGETFPVSGYDYLSMNYLLVPADKEVVDLTFGYSENNTTVEKTRTVGSVPVQRNYRTNIYGQLFTSDVDINVEIKPGFEDDKEGVEPHPNVGSADDLILAAQMGGEYTLTEDVTLTEPLNIPEGVTFVLDLNGKTITAESGNAFVNKGTLILKGNVTTRTSSLATITSATTYGVNNSGNLTVNGVKINAIYNSGKLTFNDGIIENTISGKHGIYHCGSELVINAGTFSSTSGNELIHATNANTTTINGGTFTQIGKSYLFGNGSAAIVINGGTFNGYVNENGTNDKMRPGSAVVKGGTFNFDASAWVAEGYYANATDENTYVVNDGVIAEDSAELVSAITAGAAKIYLTAGEYVLPNSIDNNASSITFIGEGKNTTIVNMPGNQWNNNALPGVYAKVDADVVFKDLTCKTNNDYMTGAVAQAKSVTFEKCNIIGGYHAMQTNKFIDCTIDPLNDYIYTYAGNCTFERCTFNSSEGKAVQVYAETTGVSYTIDITSCTFTASKAATTWDGKPVTAIDINSINSNKFAVNIIESTATGYATGFYSNSSLWNIKGGEDNVTVKIDGVLVD